MKRGYTAHNSSQRALHSILRCPPGLWLRIRRFCISVQAHVTRGRTLRGVPRLFVLRKFFFLVCVLTVTFFVYLKWYFPSFLTSTMNRSNLEEFTQDWCRVRRVATDWELLRRPCKGNTKYGVDLHGWDRVNRTDPTQSFIPVMDIKPAGEFSRFSIQSQTSHGKPKTIGGDDWRVLIWGPTSFAPTVIDHENGTYEVLFLVLEAGTYYASIILDYSLCDGMKNPPDYWFMLGNIHGNGQPHGILLEPYVYLQRPLWEGIPLTITVPPPSGSTRYEEFLNFGLENPSTCGLDCKLLWDGFGRWSSRTWKPHVPGLWMKRSPRNQEGVLWIYGDSNAGRFYRSIRQTDLCKTVFRGCALSYNWIYPIKNATLEKNQRNFLQINITRILDALANVIHSSHMNDANCVILLNHGLHFITSTNFSTYRAVIDGIVDLFKETATNEQGVEELTFRGKLIWKTNAGIHRERLEFPHHHKRRFLTRQRVQLYNAYATWAMCGAGFEVLDVYSLSASYPNGTDNRYNPFDSVHYKDSVFKPAEEILLQYFRP
ncbi:uncharacterized protein [Montipora foliosa]|uniref:uncharacterized protein n=1 Tax=Montipora foliosa TaxID=591990 RepID=UPI0035F20D1F